ncbi:MAG: efflux RND transporter periplasmic adaptor subunit [Bacteroidales bacterium]|nr:efflux RND transporter periplasmic adaptor subunit [Bacteroidales bacterium]
MKKQILIATGVVIVVIIAMWYFWGGESATGETIRVRVKHGEFRITVTTTGELEAKSSEEIYGPEGLQRVRIWQTKIDDIVPDGTVVDSGDWVATLDRTELSNRVKDQELEVEQLETQFTKTQLDTTLEMRNLRDELINLKYALEERRITLENSKYEPPATIRQAEIDLDRAQRAYNQAVKNYSLKLEKARANMQDVSTQLSKAQNRLNEMMEVLGQFTVFAPKSGMVIYKRGWDGKKMGVGAQISSWDNVVATLPNLTVMNSKTFVNEIDISKVKAGQPVEVGIDAFPEKKFTGSVTQVANIGEQMKNSNAKVFEVMIEVNEFDSVMRPAMTTKNVIITDVIRDVLYLPVECIHSNDSLSYVVTPGSRRQVIVGKSNENEIIIRAGLDEDDEVYLVPPEGYEDMRLVTLDRETIEKYRAPEEEPPVADTMQAEGRDRMPRMREDKMKQRTAGERRKPGQ